MAGRLHFYSRALKLPFRPLIRYILSQFGGVETLNTELSGAMFQGPARAFFTQREPLGKTARTLRLRTLCRGERL
jgi:hypothetical protein